jgi:hypothetical protein
MTPLAFIGSRRARRLRGQSTRPIVKRRSSRRGDGELGGGFLERPLAPGQRQEGMGEARRERDDRFASRRGLPGRPRPKKGRTQLQVGLASRDEARRLAVLQDPPLLERGEPPGRSGARARW